MMYVFGRFMSQLDDVNIQPSVGMSPFIMFYNGLAEMVFLVFLSHL